MRAGLPWRAAVVGTSPSTQLGERIEVAVRAWRAASRGRGPPGSIHDVRARLRVRVLVRAGLAAAVERALLEARVAQEGADLGPGGGRHLPHDDEAGGGEVEQPPAGCRGRHAVRRRERRNLAGEEPRRSMRVHVALAEVGEVLCLPSRRERLGNRRSCGRRSASRA
jgi:hypothetical protein